MKKIFNFREFVNENNSFNEWYNNGPGDNPHGHSHEEETIDADYEELEFCPECGDSWEECKCEHHDMTHVPAHEMELAHEDYSFLDEDDTEDAEETNEKKKMNAGFAAYLAKKKAGKKADDAEKEHKSGKKSKSGSKPDFLDLDKDGNKKESMKKAAQDAKKK